MELDLRSGSLLVLGATVNIRRLTPKYVGILHPISILSYLASEPRFWRYQNASTPPRAVSSPRKKEDTPHDLGNIGIVPHNGSSCLFRHGKCSELSITKNNITP